MRNIPLLHIHKKSFALIRESFALFRESYALIREKYKEPVAEKRDFNLNGDLCWAFKQC